jgi:hypothetical protein
MKKIKVDKHIALVDDEDFEKASQYKWYCFKGIYTYYFATNFKCADGKTRTQYLHRLVIGLEPGDDSDVIVHHRDENGLNNQKHNLEKTDASGNQMEIGCRKTNTTGFLGVTRDKTSPKRPFKAQTQIGGKTKTIGRFATAEEAARARDKYILELHGDKAAFNFPLSDS